MIKTMINTVDGADALSDAAKELMKAPVEAGCESDCYWKIAMWLEYRAAAMRINVHLEENSIP